MIQQIDHLVVAAPTLADGVQWCESTLGVTPGPGGKHALMGTHNRLALLASPAFPQAYLEIIAIDPEAPQPVRKRWFEMDRRAGASNVKLVHWVLATDELTRLRGDFVAAALDPGVPIAAERQSPNGLLRWQITVRDDGRLLCGGALPTLIEWQSAHPTERMAASGLTLHGLTLRGLPPLVADRVQAAGVRCAADAGPAISAEIDGPRGRITLSSD